MSESDPSNLAALLEEWSETELTDLLRADLAREGGPSDPRAVLRVVSLAVLRRSFPAPGVQPELAAMVDEIVPLLLSHEGTRLRLERLVGSLARDGREAT